MKYLSVCSGIEAATVAWHPLGWEPVAFSEIEPFPSAVLAHHYPSVPNVGDMTKHKEWNLEPIDLLVGGTPCQSFSVAGLRKGLDDPRGNLMLTYLAIADQRRPTWLVWENVPGVLSSNGGKDFGAFLGGLAELGYGFAYRVLDAQYFGVAQRRRRVFVVGYLGDWRPAAAVLFERDSLCGNPAPSREAGKGFATGVAQCFEPRSPDGHARLIGNFSPTLNRMGGGQREPCVIQPFPTVGALCAQTGRSNSVQDAEQNHLMAIPIDTMNHIGRKDSHSFGDFEPGAPSYTLTKGHSHAVAQPMAFDLAQITSAANRTRVNPELPASTLSKGSDMHVASMMAVRRLTPRECERLQGFPDDYTDIQPKGKPTPDGPRYKALGNSMAMPVMNWIGKRIQEYMNEHHYPGH